MVDLFQLLYDTTAIVAYLVLPVAIFAALFLLAWERGLEGDLVGFGKRTFLLLLVGGVIGYLANLPFFTWNGSVLMVNVGGALLPVAVSLVVLDQRILPGRTRELALFLGMLTLAVSATLVALVELPTRLGLVGFLACFALSGALLVALRRRRTSTTSATPRANGPERKTRSSGPAPPIEPRKAGAWKSCGWWRMSAPMRTPSVEAAKARAGASRRGQRSPTAARAMRRGATR